MNKKIVCNMCKSRETVEKAIQVTQAYSLPTKKFPLGKTKTSFKEINVCRECTKLKLKKRKK